jgi:4-hydroxy-tetrahydrodipicolinate reductase
MIPLIIHGAGGRMGRRVIELALADAGAAFGPVLGIERPGHPAVGTTAGGVPVVDSFPAALERLGADAAAAGAGDFRAVVVDFSSPAALPTLAAGCVRHRLALVSGTTGYGAAEQARLAEMARSVAVVWAPNMSLGVHLLYRLVAEAARSLGDAAEVEIVETHHRHKADAPSGTAARLADLVRQARQDGEVRVGRSGNTPGGRPPAEIGVHSVRMGEVVGDHEVHFALDHEILTLSHRALGRDVFASGALVAARFAAGAAPGLYGMDAVLARGAGGS